MVDLYPFGYLGWSPTQDAIMGREGLVWDPGVCKHPSGDCFWVEATYQCNYTYIYLYTLVGRCKSTSKKNKKMSRPGRINVESTEFPWYIFGSTRQGAWEVIEKTCCKK